MPLGRRREQPVNMRRCVRNSKFADSAIDGVAINVACCDCGGGPTASTDPRGTIAALPLSLSPVPTDPWDPTAALNSLPAPTPGCVHEPGDWKCLVLIACADYAPRSYCAAEGGYGSGWGKGTDGSFDDRAVNGGAPNISLCGAPVTGKHACQGPLTRKPLAKRWNVAAGFFSAAARMIRMRCATRLDLAPRQPLEMTEQSTKIVGGLVAHGVIAGIIGAATIAKRTATAGTVPEATTCMQTTHEVQATAVTATMKDWSSSLLRLWILLGILVLDVVALLRRQQSCRGSVGSGRKRCRQWEAEASKRKQCWGLLDFMVATVQGFLVVITFARDFQVLIYEFITAAPLAPEHVAIVVRL